MSEKLGPRSTTEGEIVKAPFVAPAIVTLALTPVVASAGSRDHEMRERARDHNSHGKHDLRRGDD
jgi:hypothetical protein